MTVCDWRAGERTLVGHVRYCYPRTMLFLVIVSTATLVLMILQAAGVFDRA